MFSTPKPKMMNIIGRNVKDAEEKIFLQENAVMLYSLEWWKYVQYWGNTGRINAGRTHYFLWDGTQQNSQIW